VERNTRVQRSLPLEKRYAWPSLNALILGRLLGRLHRGRLDAWTHRTRFLGTFSFLSLNRKSYPKTALNASIGPKRGCVRVQPVINPIGYNRPSAASSAFKGRAMNNSLFARCLVLLVATSLGSYRTQPHRAQESMTQTVYITRTGTEYHRGNCRYLAHSKIATTLKDAKANGYTACRVCNPTE
jgi:hypothetical protein